MVSLRFSEWMVVSNRMSSQSGLLNKTGIKNCLFLVTHTMLLWYYSNAL